MTAAADGSEKYDLGVAERQDHREIGALAGLKAFIIDTEDLIKADTTHFVEEGFSDAFAIFFSGQAAFQSAVSQSIAPMSDDIGNIGSAVCAFLLMYGLYSQRREKTYEFSQALQLFIDYEDDADDVGHEKAVEILTEKMNKTGFRYVGISSNIRASEFRPTKYRKIAQKHGIFSKNVTSTAKFKQRIANTRQYLRKPKAEIAFDGFHHIDQALDLAAESGKFLFHTGGDIWANFCRAHWVAYDTNQGLKSAWYLHATQYNRRKLAREIADAYVNNQMTAEQLKAFSMDAAREIEKEMTDEQKDAVRDALRDLVELRKSSHKTKKFLFLQLGYIGFQCYQGITSSVLGDKNKAYISAWSIVAALGPLSGFSRELSRKVSKIDSKRSQKVENLARILQIHIAEPALSGDQ